MSKTNTTVGINGGTLLGVAFVVLKLLGVIKWSWLWVLSPFWIIPALFLFGFIVFMIVKIITKS